MSWVLPQQCQEHRPETVTQLSRNELLHLVVYLVLKRRYFLPVMVKVIHTAPKCALQEPTSIGDYEKNLEKSVRSGITLSCWFHKTNA